MAAPDGLRPYFGPARVAVGIVLVFGAVALMVIDALRPDYTLDTIQLGLMLGSGLLVLGVEAGRKLLG